MVRCRAGSLDHLPRYMGSLHPTELLEKGPMAQGSGINLRVGMSSLTCLLHRDTPMEKDLGLQKPSVHLSFQIVLNRDPKGQST